MNETKKGLRIVAGILLLVLAVFSLAASVYGTVSVVKTDPTMLKYYWNGLASGLLGLVVAILILTRKFTGAGVVECLILVVSLTQQILVNILPTVQNADGSASILMTTLLVTLLNLVPMILYIIALFLHNRASKPILIIGAILALALSIESQAVMLVNYLQHYSFAQLMNNVGMSMGLSLATATVSFVAWILLAAYFGAQNKKA